MKSIFKRTLVLILTIVMLFGCLPVEVFADTDFTITGNLNFVYSDGSPANENVEDLPFLLEDENGRDLSNKFVVAEDGSFTFNVPNDELAYYLSIRQGSQYEFDWSRMSDDLHADYIKDGNRIMFMAENGYDWSYSMKGEEVYVLTNTGNLTITKYRSGTNDVKVAGATYQLTYLGTSDLPRSIDKGTHTTNDDGSVTIKNLPVGRYSIVETDCPDDYFLNTSATNYTLESGDQNFHASDEAKCSVTLRKTNGKEGDDKEYLQGTKFEFFKYNDGGEDEKIGGTYTTDADGKIYIDGLRYGKYYFVETQTIPNYTMSTAPTEVTLSGNNVNATVDVSNYHYPLVTFEKIDGDTGDALEGSILAIYYGNKTEPEVITSASSSSYSCYLKPGHYRLEETQAPSGYTRMTGSINFDVLPGQDKTVTVENYKPTTNLAFYKYETGTTRYISDVHFVLETISGTKIDEWTSINAPHSVSGLKDGTYILKETSTPNGYIKSKDTTITISNLTKNISYSVDGEDAVNASTNHSVYVYNSPITVRIFKKDAIDNSNVKNATLKLFDSSENLVKQFTTTDNYYEIKGELQPGNYTLKEDVTPAGYKTASPLDITIENTADIQTFTMTDERVTGSLVIKKVEKGSNPEKLLGNAEFKVFRGDTLVGEYNTGSTGIITIPSIDVAIFNNGEAISPIEYRIVENKAPAGYVIETGEKTVTFNILDGSPDKSINKEIIFENDYTKVNITKTDITTGDFIIGAHLAIYKAIDVDADGKPTGSPVAQWISGDSAHQIDRLPTGNYILIETQAPDGYLISENISFTVSNSGNILPVNMKDDYTKIAVFKLDAVDDTIIAGAKLALYRKEDINEDGKVIDGRLPVDRWTSTTYSNGHSIDRLKTGDYVLIEEEAPLGYIKSKNNIEFTITNSASTQTIVMKNDRIKLDVAKSDIDDFDKASPKLLSNAHISIYRSDDVENGIPKQDAVPVYSFITGDGFHTIEKIYAGDYVAIETQAPSGYVVSDAINFTVEESNENKLIIYDDYTKVSFKKLEINTTNHLSGATLSLYKAEDLDDLGNPLADKEPIKTWVSDNNNYTITKLPAGNYVLKEISAPNGYVKAENITFTVLSVSDIQTVTMEDDFTKVEITKSDITTGLPVVGASMLIYKASDVDESGNVVENASFVDQWVTEETPHLINRMHAGDYVLIELTAPNGYVKAQNVMFTVAPIGTVQKVNMDDNYTKVDIQKFDYKTNEVLAGATLSLFDDADNLIDTWETSNEKHRINYLTIGKTYRIVETKAPNGYATASDVLFTVDNSADVKTINIYDSPLKVSIKKIDSETETQISDAELKIFKSEDVNDDGTIKENANAVYSFTTKSSSELIEYIPAGDYVLMEVKTPKGYIKANNVKFTIIDTNVLQSVIMYDTPTRVVLTKVDEDDYPLVDTEIAIFKNGTEIIRKSTDNNGLIELKYLETNQEYTFKETKATDTYSINPNTFSFTILENGTVVGDTKITDEVTKLVIEKKDIDGNPVDNTRFSMTDGKGITVYAVTDANGIATFTAFATGSYIIKETDAKQGYVSNTSFSKSIENDGTWNNNADYAKISVINDYTKVKIYKVDAVSKQLIAGAKLQLVSSSGNVVDEWTSNDTESHYIEKIEPGYYNIIETKAPNGYLTVSVMSIYVDNTGDIQEYYVDDEFTTIQIDKLIKGTTEHLSGASLKLVDENNNLIDEWISDGSSHLIDHVNPGKYKIIEVSSPKGYIPAKPVEITVEAKTELQSFVIENDFTKIEINKVDKETKEFLSGATLQLLDNENNVLYEWETAKQPYYIEKLPIGVYRLVETNVPSGYIKSQDVSINVESTTETQKFFMEDDFIKLSFIKVNSRNNERVSGAQLQLRNENGDIIANWTSTTDAYSITRIPAGKYFVTEIKNPDGFIQRENDYEISVLDTSDVQGFALLNEPDLYNITISKIDATTKDELPGAKLIVKDEFGNIIDEWISTTEKHIINDIKPGKYTITEITSPDGYFKAETVEFELLLNNKSTVTDFTIENDYSKLEINKLIKGTDMHLAGAKLHIEDENGKIYETWESDGKTHVVNKLPAGKYKLVEDDAPDGYILAHFIDFEIKDGQTETITLNFENETVSGEIPTSPKTGDSTNTLPYFVSMILSLLGIILLSVSRKKYIKS